MRNWRRLANTLRYLKVSQLVFFIIRRKFPASPVAAPTAVPQPQALALQPPIPVVSLLSDGAFTFLNTSRQLGMENLDWSPTDVQRLWRYNLHYFDYLRQEDIAPQDKQGLLADWVQHNPQPSQPGWEPFTASLRIVNWVFFLNGCNARGEELPAAVLTSLYEQALWLEKNDERHILANHYFENLKALVFAGSFFSGADARRWLNKGVQGLQQELREQILPDGGHYERTPQYHALMLENYLDLYSLASGNPDLFSAAFIEQLHKAADSGLAFLEGIVFPDERLPLFNDSAFGIAPELAELRAYAGRLFERPTARSRGPLIEYAHSGLYGYRTGEDMLIVDCGDIGPPYQPGHTHCDFLSYELMLGGRRLVVDTGVCEYEPGEMRHYVRSTAAHNTVTVDGDEQSEIWGEFRVARRARKLSASVALHDDAWRFEGAFSGFYGVGGMTHRRTIALSLQDDGTVKGMQVTDVIDGRGERLLESRIHLHPDITTAQRGGQLLLLRDGVEVAVVEPTKGVALRTESTVYCPEFGLRQDNKCVVLSIKSALPCEFGYALHRR